MKRKSILFLVVVLLLCAVTTAFGKGELGDNDAYSVYMGLSKTEVRRIAPIFEEISDSIFFVDKIEEDDALLGIAVNFSDSNVVNAVLVIENKSALSEMNQDTDLVSAASLGLFLLGFSSDDITGGSTDSDGDFVIDIKGGITAVASEVDEDTYLVMSFK